MLLHKAQMRLRDGAAIYIFRVVALILQTRIRPPSVASSSPGLVMSIVHDVQRTTSRWPALVRDDEK